MKMLILYKCVLVGFWSVTKLMHTKTSDFFVTQETGNYVEHCKCIINIFFKCSSICVHSRSHISGYYICREQELLYNFAGEICDVQNGTVAGVLSRVCCY